MGRYYIVMVNEACLERFDIPRATGAAAPSGGWTNARPGLQRQEIIYFTLRGLRLSEINDIPLLLGFTATYK